jgi:hypothetical protein
MICFMRVVNSTDYLTISFSSHRIEQSEQYISIEKAGGIHMAENEKCAHGACDCRARRDSNYCSEY